ncbi:MAG: peptidylprolyl isomerase [Acidobacteriota bacterium]
MRLLLSVLLFALASLALALSACRRSAPSNVAAAVNDRPITYQELEKQYKSEFSSPVERPSEEQVWYQKLELLRVLVEKEIMWQRAERAGLLAVDADVDAKLNELRAGSTQEEFQKQLLARNLTLDDLRAQLRRDLSIQKLFNKEITSHIGITEKEVADFYNANRASFNLPEPQYHVAHILVTPYPDSAVRNLKGDKAQNEQQARKKIEMLAARIRQGEDFAMLAQNFSEDANTSANGGDFGFIPESALAQANVELRKVLVSLKPGQVSPIVRSAEGYRLLRLISREPAGQRNLEDPRVQQNIRETLLNRKDQLLRAAYYEVARSEAQVVNYLARRISAAKGKM